MRPTLVDDGPVEGGICASAEFTVHVSFTSAAWADVVAGGSVERSTRHDNPGAVIIVRTNLARRYAATSSGFAHGHHGEVLQGFFHDEQGEVMPGLVSWPAHWCQSRVSLTHDELLDKWVCGEPDSKKTVAAVEAVLSSSTGPGGGVIRVDSNIPRGRGLGSSTADVVAAIRAAQDFVGESYSDEKVAALGVSIEDACDATMFSDLVLFASRHGKVLEYLRGTVPRHVLLSVDLFDQMGAVETQSVKFPAISAECCDRYEALLVDG